MIKKFCFFVVLLLVLSQSIFSHPHLYIDLCLSVEMNEYGITGFWEEWRILRNFGKDLVIEYDKNNNGVFDAKEAKLLKEEVFDNIKKNNYYTYLDHPLGTFYPADATNFSASINLDGVVFSFFVPCKIEADNKYKSYELSIHDLSHYVSFGFVYMNDPYSSSIDYNIAIERDSSYYSHSCEFGNAVVIINMKLSNSSAKPRHDATAEIPKGMLKMNKDNPFIKTTIKNPFLDKNTNIKAENTNPFLGY